MDESQVSIRGRHAGDFVEFVRAESSGRGEFACTGCGFSITACGQLPRCPSCGEGLWERADWSPFANALAGLRSRLG
jgi:rubrerythrin